MLGCLDESCAPLIAAVLEARHVIYGGVRHTSDGWQMQLVHLNVDKGVTLKRTEERAPSMAALRTRVPALADDLALSLREPTVGIDVLAGATLLKNRNDCVWGATRLFRARERRLRPIDRVYVAHFDSTHFDLGEFDRMRRVLPLARRALFPGQFPACHGRTMATQDAFLIEDAQTVAALVDRQAATSLSGRRKDRKLTLELAFKLVDSSFSPLPPPDLALCGPPERERVPELSPTVTIRVVGGAVVDSERGTRTPLGILSVDGLAFSRLDDPGSRR